MSREILGGNSTRRAEGHKRAMHEKPGPDGPIVRNDPEEEETPEGSENPKTKEEWMEENYATLREVATEAGIFDGDLSKEDLVDVIVEEEL